MCCLFVEFLSDCRQRVVIDDVAIEWIPIVSGVPQGSVCAPFSLSFIYTSEMFELVENRFYSYADDSTLLAVVPKPADRPAIAAYLSRDLAKIQEWCIHWCKILIPNKSETLVVTRSRILNNPLGDLVLYGVSM